MERCCRSCKWWELEDNRLRIHPRPDWGRCDLGESDSSQPVNVKTLALAQDLESYQAVLETHETFGCVQFEPKVG